VLFVVHQDVPLSELTARCAALHPATLLIVSTHAPFPEERARWRALAPEVKLYCFADLLSDSELAGCDAVASREALRELPQAHRGYTDLFMERSVRCKNELVRDKLLHARSTRVFFAEGLGIDAATWRAVGEPLPAVQRRTARKQPVERLRRLFSQELHLLSPTGSQQDKPALLLGSSKRLALREEVARARLVWPLPWRFTPGRVQGRALGVAARTWLRTHALPNDYLLCTTIHQYESAMSELAAQLGRELSILVDGHHPSNYPASYLDGYGSGRFVAANGVSAAWFMRHGREVVPRLWFQRALSFAPCRTSRSARIMLVLNHAGDWTALINRSDTDRLIEGFVALARRFVDKEFVIRLHPTMAHPRHEGLDSMRRVRSFVDATGLPNLSVSSASLEEDMQRGDVYVCEYSQVLIDAWAVGKLGLAVNGSGRRSFMADYEALGFHAVESIAAMHDWFDSLDAELARRVALQNEAVVRFNARQAEWEAPRS